MKIQCSDIHHVRSEWGAGNFPMVILMIICCISLSQMNRFQAMKSEAKLLLSEQMFRNSPLVTLLVWLVILFSLNALSR
jgi:hypothetical protein